MKHINDHILEVNRMPKLSDWFNKTLNELISFGYYQYNDEELAQYLIEKLADYRMKHGINQVVIGISGGIDSALTATLFRDAGWNVHGMLMPIRQKPEETDRGVEVANALGITYEVQDLSDCFDNLIQGLEVPPVDFHDGKVDGKDTSWSVQNAIRTGNIRARLRMMCLYNKASVRGGLVASTDNFSELAAGFWTLHGDVGDVAPIQSLTKSWEVPILAARLGVPQSILDAVPTDGLGISTSDEEQLGCSYLEFDLALFKLMRGGVNLQEMEDDDVHIIKNVGARIKRTTFKRANPLNLPHPWDFDRYAALEKLDTYLFEEITWK